jgi:hypothetical protein
MQRDDDRKNKKNDKIFTGKHGPYEQTGIFSKEGGTIPKVVSEVLRTNKKRPLNEKIIFVEKIECDGRGSIVREKICLDCYRAAGESSTADLAPVSRIALRNDAYMKEMLLMFFSSRGNDAETAKQLMECFLAAIPSYGNARDKRYATFLGKMINQYADLGNEFVEFIGHHHRPPETIKKENQEYRLDGLMKIAAIAKILGDPDWLGGSGDNTGFVIKDGYAMAMLVDAGLALTEHIRLGPDSQNIQTAMNIQFANGLPVSHDIHFDKLTEKQKEEFVGTLYKFIHCENLRGLIEFLVKREDAFNSYHDDGGKITLLDDQIANQMIDKIIQNIDTLSKTYHEALKEYQESTKQLLIIPMTEFNIAMPSSDEVSPKPDKAPDNSSWWPMLMIGAGVLTLGSVLAIYSINSKKHTVFPT